MAASGSQKLPIKSNPISSSLTKFPYSKWLLHSNYSLSLLILLSLSSQLTQSSSSSNPKSLILPITKDPSTLQYLTKISIGTPLVSKSLVVNLGGRYLWIDCEKDYNSSTHKPGYCGSSTCSITKPMGFGCTDCKRSPYPDCNNTCSLIPENSVTGLVTFEGAVGLDTISVQITNGPKSRPTVMVPNFIFSCAKHSLLKGLAKGAKGMATLGRNRISLPNQLSLAFGGSMPRKFAICLPSAPKLNGVVLFGDTKYVFYPSYNTSKRNDVSERFKYTRLYINPISTSMIYMNGEPSADYFIGVKSIMVNKKPIPINPTLLSFNRSDFGNGGTIISTVIPYTRLETSIYTAFVDAVVKEFTALNVTRVAPVEPFTACFSTERMSYEILGPSAPDIEFVMENKDVVWGMYGYNTMVEISKEVVCLGFVDGGSTHFQPAGTRHMKPSIVIGALQLENNLLQFDLASSTLAFTGTLLWEEVRCENFAPTL